MHVHTCSHQVQESELKSNHELGLPGDFHSIAIFALCSPLSAYYAFLLCYIRND